ncbi:uncharacterized protein LOC125781046 [Astyanax mexicanus]|uniref:uncharacterized protein LOC125781046 n=1 Tax=Astyanax mexicanus TaxID=7994 RepID=UPI0020CB1A32|nr:uncharacterized protein LOC125781046 [Astyanax mexicanus]
MLAASICVLCVVFGVQSAAVTTLPDVNLGDPITLPCKDHDHEDTPVEQLDVQWRLGEQLVIRLFQGQVNYGINYRNRTELPAEGSSRGDFSLIITHTQHGDSGVYQCVIRRENQEEPLGEVQLRVKAPPSPSAVFVKVGEEVVLPCFGRVDWFKSEAELVQWFRGDQLVLQWEKGSLYVDHLFTDRVSLSKDRILKDDLSLVLKNTIHEDQGLYLCSFVKDQTITPAVQTNLTVTDHQTRLEVGAGSSVLLPLHTASAVKVWFLPDGGNGTVSVCEVEEDQLKCEVSYTGRTVLHEASLKKLEIHSVVYSGTFSVMERESHHTVNVLFLQVLPAGEPVVNAAAVLIITVTVVVLMGISVATFVIKLKRYRRRRSTLEQADEALHQKPTDTTSIEMPISKNEQSVEGII